MLKREAESAVLRATIAGRDVVIKIRKLARFGDRIKHILDLGRASRQWRGSELLARLKISTARPLALATEHRNKEAFEWLILEALPGKTVLQHLADRDLTARQEHLIACELGILAESLHTRGYFNRDPKPSNLIVTSLDPVRIAVIDSIAIQRRRDRGLERMLASMVIEPIGCRCPPRRALMMRAVSVCRSESPRVLWKKVSAVVATHGDPTPKSNPLAANP